MLQAGVVNTAAFLGNLVDIESKLLIWSQVSPDFHCNQKEVGLSKAVAPAIQTSQRGYVHTSHKLPYIPIFNTQPKIYTLTHYILKVS